MASIQILEISPVEVQVEDLSDNVTLNIRGGGPTEFAQAVLQCVDFFFTNVGSNEFEPIEVVGAFLGCLGEAFDLL